jgi:hypothetical protein
VATGNSGVLEGIDVAEFRPLLCKFGHEVTFVGVTALGRFNDETINSIATQQTDMRIAAKARIETGVAQFSSLW